MSRRTDFAGILLMAAVLLTQGLGSQASQVLAAEAVERREIPAEIGPERIVFSGGVQPFMFRAGEKTLMAMAWLSLPPGHQFPEVNVFPGIPGWIISQDNGASWKRWTPKGVMSASPYDPPAPAPGFEGSGARLTDGTAVILEWAATGRRADGAVTARLWESNDDCRTMQGPIEIRVDLPQLAQQSADDSGRRSVGLYFHKTLLQLPNGDLLTTAYGSFREDTTPVAYQPKMMKMRCILLRSTDRGRSWQFVSTIAVDPSVGQEGFDEPVMVRLTKGPRADGLICLMRTGRDTPLYQTHSDDHGTTWSAPHAPGFFGVDPLLVELSDGTLVGGFVWLKAGDNRNSGAPTYLAVSRDQGQTWSELIRMPDGENPRYGRWSSYGALAEIAPNRLLVIYDVIPGGWHGPIRHVAGREIQVPLRNRTSR